MCGIVGAVSKSNVVDTLIEGLRRLEYRGYDSCGFAVIDTSKPNHPLQRARTTARVADLAKQASEFNGHIGIAHTRWATHGKPDTQNAHPHISNNLIALVHNGIIENYEPLREQLITAGYQFSSETDTEVIAHLVHREYVKLAKPDLREAVAASILQLKGAYAIAVISQTEPKRLIGARAGSPLIVALGNDGHYLSSDALARGC